MNFQDLANLGEIIGGVAVVVSLIYLAVQVRQNTTSQQTENYARALDRIATLQALFGKDGGLSVMFAKGVRNPSDLQAGERIQFTWILYEMFGAFEFMFHASLGNAIPDEVWKRWELTIAYWLGHPGVQTWWGVRPAPFTASFTAYVESAIGKIPAGAEPGRAWSDFVGVP